MPALSSVIIFATSAHLHLLQTSKASPNTETHRKATQFVMDSPYGRTCVYIYRSLGRGPGEGGGGFELTGSNYLQKIIFGFIA
jgi:hypothetical protein